MCYARVGLTCCIVASDIYASTKPTLNRSALVRVSSALNRSDRCMLASPSTEVHWYMLASPSTEVHRCFKCDDTHKSFMNFALCSLVAQ